MGPWVHVNVNRYVDNYGYVFGYHNHSTELFFVMLKKMTEMLAENGTLLIDFQHTSSYLKGWLEQLKTLNSLPGNLSVTVSARSGVLRITKVPPLDNPDILAHKTIKIG